VRILGIRQIIFQRQNGQKYFVQNGQGQNGRETIFGYFGYILDPSQKMSILPFARRQF
jgi:hypothetical protein